MVRFVYDVWDIFPDYKTQCEQYRDVVGSGFRHARSGLMVIQPDAHAAGGEEGWRKGDGMTSPKILNAAKVLTHVCDEAPRACYQKLVVFFFNSSKFMIWHT